MSVHVGTGTTASLAAYHEYAFGRWPSLVLDLDGTTVQIDLDPALTDAEARAIAAALVVGVGEWQTALGTSCRRPIQLHRVLAHRCTV